MAGISIYQNSGAGNVYYATYKSVFYGGDDSLSKYYETSFIEQYGDSLRWDSTNDRVNELGEEIYFVFYKSDEDYLRRSESAIRALIYSGAVYKAALDSYGVDIPRVKPVEGEAVFPTAAPAQVATSFRIATGYANDASKRLDSFTDSLKETIYQPPTISVEWKSITPPAIDWGADVPTMPIIEFQAPGNMPAPIDTTGLDVDVQIDDFDVEPPTLSFGAAPNIVIGTAPVIPQVKPVAVPDAPTITLPAAPSYLTIATRPFGGVNLHEDWLTKLQDVPELELMQPTPWSYQRGPQYASQLLENLKGVIGKRLLGGTGLNPGVEQALWDRARDRETQIALANEKDVMRASEALGFALPPGALAAQLRDARQAYHDKLSTLSREISIEQAKLEQENLKQAIAEGMQLESQLMDYALKLEQMAFDAARAAAENSLQIYNAGVERFKALLQGFQVYAATYETIIKAELNKVEVYKAELEGEKIKADINASLVQQYKAEIEGSMAVVEIYKSQVSGAQVLVELEKSKLEAAGEQVRAFVASINAETAKVEIYKAGITAEATKMEGYKSLTQAYQAKAGAQAEKARVAVAKIDSVARAKGIEWDGYKARLSAESARIDALGKQSGVLSDAYRAGAAATTAKAEMTAKLWEAQIRQYEAGQNIAMSTAKINADIAMTANSARADSAKAGAQVYAQLAASAYGMINASASNSQSMGFSKSESTSQSISASV